MSGVKYNPTTQDRAQMEAWLKERPEIIQRMAAKFPPWHCYRLAKSGGHYTIYSYCENGTVMLTHGDDSTLPGVEVFGIAPDDLIVCDCGKWEFPTAKNIARTDRRIKLAQQRRKERN